MELNENWQLLEYADNFIDALTEEALIVEFSDFKKEINSIEELNQFLDSFN